RPWIAKSVCPGEYCQFGTWRACTTLVARNAKQRDAPVIFTIRRGEEFTAVDGDVHVEVPGVVVFRYATANPPMEVHDDSIRFTPADTLFLLNEFSEGYLNWWFRGRAGTGRQFWTDRP